MRIAGICFTRSGMRLAERISDSAEEIFGCKAEIVWACKGKNFADINFSAPGNSTGPFHCREIKQSAAEWAGDNFNVADCLVFIGAVGIAVRSLAPYIRDKRLDPAVICLDEKGKFCISLLSGHIGGANQITAKLADQLGSIPVITTATDINNKFAVDVYATEHELTISNMTYAKEVSAALVAGENVGLYTNFPVDGKIPEGLTLISKHNHGEALLEEISSTIGIYISPSYHSAFFDHTLWLIPKCLTIGIGCKRGTSVDKIRKLVDDTLQSLSLYPEAISRIATIDIKKDEPGLLQFCRERELPLETFTAEDLKTAVGDFSSSAFVSSVTGVDNVCERSAVLAGKGRLIMKKIKGDGVTCAVVLEDWRVKF